MMVFSLRMTVSFLLLALHYFPTASKIPFSRLPLRNFQSTQSERVGLKGGDPQSPRTPLGFRIHAVKIRGFGFVRISAQSDAVQRLPQKTFLM